MHVSRYVPLSLKWIKILPQWLSRMCIDLIYTPLFIFWMINYLKIWQYQVFLFLEVVLRRLPFAYRVLLSYSLVPNLPCRLHWRSRAPNQRLQMKKSKKRRKKLITIPGFRVVVDVLELVVDFVLFSYLIQTNLYPGNRASTLQCNAHRNLLDWILTLIDITSSPKLIILMDYNYRYPFMFTIHPRSLPLLSRLINVWIFPRRW